MMRLPPEKPMWLGKPLFARKFRIAWSFGERLELYQRLVRLAANRIMHPLDNPIWNALSTRQAHFAERFGSVRRFSPEVTPLAGFEEVNEGVFESLRGMLALESGVGLFLPARIEAPTGLEIMMEGPLLQMILENDGHLPASTHVHEFIELGPADVPEMVALTTLTKPGPFATRTREMGTYLGIRAGGKLVAMAGERLKLPGFTEISAVCTHPDHLGHGYAGFLMTLVAERIRARGEVPFLDVRPENTRAVQLYERLGFKSRHLYRYAVFRAAGVAASA